MSALAEAPLCSAWVRVTSVYPLQAVLLVLSCSAASDQPLPEQVECTKKRTGKQAVPERLRELALEQEKAKARPRM